MRAFSIVHTSDTHMHIYIYALIIHRFSLWLVRSPPQLSKRSVIDIPKNYVHQWTEHDKPSRQWSQKKIESRMKKNRITNLHVNKTKKRTNIYTHIILLNWKKDKETRALVHLFSIKVSFFLVRINYCAHIHDNWLSDWWCITRDSSRIGMIMNIAKRETMEQVHKWSFRITINNKRFLFSSLLALLL
jgi:hypothetical protein